MVRDLQKRTSSGFVKIFVRDMLKGSVVHDELVARRDTF